MKDFMKMMVTIILTVVGISAAIGITLEILLK